jgi:hypothetical protein
MSEKPIIELRVFSYQTSFSPFYLSHRFLALDKAPDGIPPAARVEGVGGGSSQCKSYCTASRRKTLL